MTLLDQPGEADWTRIKTIDGSESWGARLNDHHLEVFTQPQSTEWGWSMTHPFICRARGAGGVARTMKQAQGRAIGAAEKCKEFE